MCLLHVCLCSHHLAFSLLMPHPSLLFPHGHFETNPDYDFTDDRVDTFLPYLLVLKAQDMRHSAHASRSLTTWPSQMQTQAVSPTSSTRILPWMMTRRSPTIRTTISPTSRKPTNENTSQVGVLTMFGSSVSHVSLVMFFFRKQGKRAIGKPLQDREIEKGKRRFL